MSSRGDHKSNTKQLLQLLDTQKIKYELLDGADPGNQELRNHLFNVSGHVAEYPQLFMCDVPCKRATKESNWKFIGLFPTIQKMNENNEYTSEFDKIFQNVPKYEKAQTSATGVVRPDGAAEYEYPTRNEHQSSIAEHKSEEQTISFEEFEKRRPPAGRSIEDWEQHSDEEGDPFWFNTHTEESSWYPPIGWEDYCKKKSS